MTRRKKKRKRAEPETEAAARPDGPVPWRSRLKLFVLAVAVVAGTAWWLLPQLGLYLAAVDETPQPADVLVVPSGDRGERMEYAVDLYRDGLADLFIVSGGPLYADLSEADLLRRHAVILGVPDSKIIMEPKAVNTYQNARNTRELMEFYNLKSALVVTSPYHMRRVRVVFDEVFADSGIRLWYAPVPDSWFDPERWWETPGGRKLVLCEYAKLSVMLLPERWRTAVLDRGLQTPGE